MNQKILIFSLLFSCFSCIKGMNKENHSAFFWRNTGRHEYPDIHHIDEFGYTQLCWAIIHGNEIYVHHLINQGANLLFKDRTGSTPLDLAHLYRHENIARLLKEEIRKKGQFR